MNYEKLPKTISAEELLSTPLPPVKWIIPDLLPAGLALFAGPSKAGKSWLTLWLCLQVAQGKPMWGREIEPHTVLYLSLEDTFNRLQKRLLQLVGSEEAPERLVMQTECGSIGQGLEEQLTSFIYQHPDTGLIVIDTLQKVRSSDQNNSMYASDYKEISALKALADKYNICILLIHHLRKQAADDPFQQIAGSNGLMGASDTSWVMQRKRMSQTASILVTGRDMDNKHCACTKKAAFGFWTRKKAQNRLSLRLCRVTFGKWPTTSIVSEHGRAQPPNCFPQPILKAFCPTS